MVSYKKIRKNINTIIKFIMFLGLVFDELETFFEV